MPLVFTGECRLKVAVNAFGLLGASYMKVHLSSSQCQHLINNNWRTWLIIVFYCRASE